VEKYIDRFGTRVHFNDINYLGTLNSKYMYLKSLVYYKDEVFAKTEEFPGLIIGNFGTIIDTERYGFKIPHFLWRENQPYILYGSVSRYGREYQKRILLSRLILMAHNPIQNWSSTGIIYLDKNPLNTVYSPGTCWHNIDWITNSYKYK